MATRIDYEKSISTDRLSWKRDTEGILSLLFDYTFWGIAILLLMGGPIYWSVKEIEKGTFGGLSVIFYFVSMALGLIVSYGVLNYSKLRRANGLDPETNRKVITRLLKRDFEKINEDASGTKVLTVRKPVGLFSFGQRVTVLFDKEDILINILTTGRHEIRSAFHSIPNDDKVKSLIKEFNREIDRDRKTPHNKVHNQWRGSV